MYETRPGGGVMPAPSCKQPNFGAARTMIWTHKKTVKGSLKISAVPANSTDPMPHPLGVGGVLLRGRDGLGRL